MVAAASVLNPLALIAPRSATIAAHLAHGKWNAGASQCFKAGMADTLFFWLIDENREMHERYTDLRTTKSIGIHLQKYQIRNGSEFEPHPPQS